MALFGHFLLFLMSAGIIWFFAGLLVDSISTVAKRFNQSGFTVAFFVLGFMTSISEISVMANSTLARVPQISAGNLAGASLVILLFIVPFLAIVGKGIHLRNTLPRRQLASVLFAIMLPNLFMLDGQVTRQEGIACLLVFGTLIYFIQKSGSNTVPAITQELKEELIGKKKSSGWDITKIIMGGVFIFLASHILVNETAYFSGVFGIPSSALGLILLSVGTNVPELVIAVRSILKKHTDIAFGDYLGSSVINTPTFGLLAVLNGRFPVEASEFIFTSIILAVGLCVFYIFAQSKNHISRQEGIVLIGFYALFLLVQGIHLARFAGA